MIYTSLHKIKPISDELWDYKFFCFNGEPQFLKVDFGRFSEHHANYYNLNWEIQYFGEQSYTPKYDFEILPPPNFNEMIGIVELLSKGHEFIRVDLFNVRGKIYFGELTFYPASGLGPWTESTVDEIIGKYINLPNV